MAAFTGILWVVTNKAANAAKEAAEALPVIERAHVYPMIVAVGPLLDCVRAAKVFYIDPPDVGGNKPCRETCELTFRIKNYGKTPAILKEVFVGFGVHPLGMEIGVTIQEGILGAGETTNDLISKMDRGLTRNEADHILFCTKHIAFIGQVLFEDIWGNEYRTKFHFAWEHSEGRMYLCGLSTARTKQTKTS